MKFCSIRKHWSKKILCLFISLFVVFIFLFVYSDKVRYSFYDKGVISPITIDDKLNYAEKLYEKQEFTKAFDLYKSVSEDNTTSDFNRGWACFRLGLLYYQGDAYVKSPAKALVYFNKSVNEFHTDVGYLGLAFYFGLERDYVKAFHYLKTAGSKGVSSAYALLADWYRKGIGVQQNYNEAINWYKKAADSDEPSDAFYWLGFLYENGLGVEKNIKRAVHWYNKGIEKGDKECEKAFVKLLPSLKLKDMR